MYELTTIENGLRILTVPMPHVQSASLGFFVGVGSRFESEALSGVSHFIEHMTFRGTQKRPTALEIAEAIEGKGGIFNASTGLEATLYWAKVAAPYLYEALDVLSDMLLNATFDPGEIEKERAVICEEIKYAEDAPDSLSQILVNGLQWPNHPLGRDIAGNPQSLATFCRPALLAYQTEHYCPRETVLALAGRVNHEEAVEWARSHLNEWDAGAIPPFEPAPANHQGPSVHVETRDTEQVHLNFSFASLSRGDPGRFALRLLNAILGEGMRSRLFQQVRERLGLAYSVDSFVSALQDTGAVGIYAGVAVDRVEEAIVAILAELDQLRQESVSQDELEKARDFVKGRLALSMEDSFTVASWYARQELLGPEVVTIESVLTHMDAVQAVEIQHLAQELFRMERLNLAVVGPFSENGTRFRQALRF